MQKRILSIKTAVVALARGVLVRIKGAAVALKSKLLATASVMTLVREVPVRIKALATGLKSKLPGTASVMTLVREVPVKKKALATGLKSKLPGTASVMTLVREVTFYEQLKKATQLSKPRNDESKLEVTASKPMIPKTTQVVGSKRK